MKLQSTAQSEVLRMRLASSLVLEWFLFHFLLCRGRLASRDILYKWEEPCKPAGHSPDCAYSPSLPPGPDPLLCSQLAGRGEESLTAPSLHGIYTNAAVGLSATGRKGNAALRCYLLPSLRNSAWNQLRFKPKEGLRSRAEVIIPEVWKTDTPDGW